MAFAEDLDFEVTIGEETIKGKLNGSFKLWRFKSDHPTFIKLYPAGEVPSFAMFGNEVPDTHKQLWEQCQAKAEELSQQP